MTRVRFPNRRPIETIELEHDGQVFTVSCGWGEDPGEERYGAALEVFVQPRKGGSMLSAMLSEFGFLVSQARRAGVTIDRLRGGMQRGDQGKPETVFGAILDRMKGNAT